MTNTEILFRFIEDNLEFGDLKQIAVSLNLSPKNPKNGPMTVSRVKGCLKKGRIRSKRIVKAMEEMAMQNYNHAQQIAEYANKRNQL